MFSDRRSENFTLNPYSPLAKGLSLAALAGAGCPQSSRYFDSSLSGNHGALIGYTGAGNTPADKCQWDPYLHRWRLGFDGTADKVVIPRAVASVAPITICCWARARNVTGSFVLGGIFSGITKDALYLALSGNVDGDPAQFWTYSNISGSYVGANAASGYSAETWYHVAGVLTANATRICYLNGVPGAEGATSPAPDSLSQTQFGSYLDGTGPTYYYYDEDVADPMVWNRVLSPSEIWDISRPANVPLCVGGVPLILPWTPRVFAAGAAATTNRRRRLLCGV